MKTSNIPGTEVIGHKTTVKTYDSFRFTNKQNLKWYVGSYFKEKPSYNMAMKSSRFM